MFEGLDGKTKLYMAGGVAGLVGILFAMNRPSTTSEGTNVNGAIVPNYKNDTVYIPTSMYEIRVNNGAITNNAETHNNNQSIQDSNNQTITGDNNKAVNEPIAYTPPVQAQTPPKVTEQPVKPVVTAPTTTAPKTNATATTYTVDSGQTLTSIAKEIGTTVNEIVKANPTTITNPNVIKAGQVIKTPTYTPAKTTTTTKTTKTHKVVKGDTLYAIAKKYNTTVNTIAKNNNIKDVNKIQVGQVLKV